MGGSEVDLTPIVGDPFADRFLFERLDYLNSLPDIRRFHFSRMRYSWDRKTLPKTCGIRLQADGL